MNMPRVGLLAFSESMAREDVYQKRKGIAVREIARLTEALAGEVELILPGLTELRGKRQAMQAVRELEAAGVEAVILAAPIFVAPAVVAHTANLLNVPAMLVGNAAEDSLSQVAFLAAGGAIDQIGAACARLPGDPAVEPHRTALLHFLRAAAAKQRLRGQTFGCIGGRALGISSGTADLALWERLFHVDIEHIDQFEIVRRTEAVSGTETERHLAWLREKAGAIRFNGENFTPAHLERQMRSYLATKRIIEDNELDFCGVKCQPEMSNGYCLQCLNVALTNDPYDADGPKEPVACSCEADADGALTMQILKLLSGNAPTSLNDIAIITDRAMTLANCGAMATAFAACAPTPEANLARVELVPHNFGEAGGAATCFTVPAGQRMTFARLFRQKDQYLLGMLSGTTVEKDRAAQSPAMQVRPLIFADINIDSQRFLSTFGSNHLLAVEGDLIGELTAFAGMLGIEAINYNR